MSRFVLTAQLQLQAPTNTAQVVRQIQSQLNGVQVNVQVQGTAQATRQVNQVAQSINAANSAASNLGRTFAISVRRFTALAVATRAVSLFTNTLANATDEAIQFERELIRVSQVTGKTVAQLRDFTKEITSLATGLGVSSTSLIKVGTILAQAGFNADQTTIALRTLAKTELSPTFENIEETAEGVVAIFSQFKQGAEALESQLGSINSVAAAFAVEAGDLIGAVRRVGGVFRASGGDLNELIALFTSVRATTRESAESIATGLRTIFTRIQRPKTIEFLKQYGVELVDLEGKFVGPFEAVRRLSGALAGLEQGDITFIRIAEELGGFRQIGKVIPLLQQFQVAQQALNVAQKGGTSLTDDAASAQAALAIRITKVKEEFLALVRSITETSSFQLFANTALNLASALIKLADALKPIIPLLTAVATIKLAQGVSSFIGGFGRGIGSGRTFNQGGKVLKFARGGMVPGSGNRDTVPAMLQPGEFVIRKSSVGKLGAGNLAAMNENRYESGIRVSRSGRVTSKSLQTASDSALNDALNTPGISKEATFKINQEIQNRQKGEESKAGNVQSIIIDKVFGASFLRGYGSNVNFESRLFDILRVGSKTGSKNLIKAIEAQTGQPFSNVAKKSVGANSAIKVIAKNAVPTFLSPDGSKIFDDEISNIIPQAFDRAAKKFNGELSIQGPPRPLSSLLSKSAISSIEGQFFEAYVRSITKNVIQDESKSDSIFDFRSINEEQANKLFGTKKFVLPNEFKNDANPTNIAKTISKVASEGTRYIKVQKFAKGGKTLIQKGQQLGGVGIFDSDKIPGGTNVKKALLEQIKASKKPYQVISGPAGSGKTTFATNRFGQNFVMSAGDIAKYSRFAILSGAGKTKTGDFSEDVKSLLSGASGITLLSPDQERLMKQRQGRLDSAMSGNLPDERSVGALQGTLKAPTDSNEDLFKRYGNVEVLQQYAAGGSVGTDTVPALLTPGEFVVNKKSAQAIGYGSLNRMNKVGKYATGGTVGTFGPKKFAAGGQASDGGNMFGGFGLQLTLVTSALQAMIPPAQENASALQKTATQFLSLATQIGSAIFALQAFGVSLNVKNIAQLFGTGPQSLGGLMKNAFSGFKMGASGMAGPMPLGGGIASRIGGMFGAGKAAVGSGLSKAGDAIGNVSTSFGNTNFVRGFIGGKQGINPLFAAAKGQNPFVGMGGSTGVSALNTSINQMGVGGRLSARVGGAFGRATSAVGGAVDKFGQSSFARGFSGGKQGINPLFAAAKGRNPFVGMGGSTGVSALKTTISQMGVGGRLSANIGGFLGKGAGLVGKAGGLAARGGAALAGGLGGAGSAALAAAGPIAAITGVVAAINSVVGNFRDLDGQIKDSIAAGKTEEAVRLSITKKASEFPVIGNIVSSIFGEAGDAFLLGVGTIFGGPTLDSVKALAESQIGAVKAQQDLVKAQKVATDAMDDFARGNITAAEALSKIREATQSTVDQEKRASNFAVSNLGNRAAEGTFTARNVLTLGGLLGETNTQRNRRLGEESASQLKEASKLEAERFQLESPARQASIREAAARDVSVEDIKQQQTSGLQARANELAKIVASLEAAGDTQGAQAAKDALNQLTSQINQTNREVENIEKEVRRAREAFEAMNLGLSSASGTATAASATLTRFANSLQVGGSTLVSDVEFLSTAMSSAAQAMNPDDIKSAIDNVAGTLEKFGVSEKFVDKFKSNTETFAKAQQNYASSVKNIISRNKEAGKSLSPEQFKEEIGKELTRGLGGVAAENLKKVINNIELTPEETQRVLDGDTSVFRNKLDEAGKKQFEEVAKILQELQKAEAVLIDLTKKRIDAERNLVQAQKEAIDLYMEGREVQASAGGAVVTSQERRDAILRKANVELGGAGLGNIGQGSAGDFRAVNKQILAQTSAFQAKAATEGGLQGVEGVKAAEQQANLQKAYKSQIETIRSLIKLEQDELKLIKEKNSLEKSSIDALISGDIDKFFEQQAAVGAQAAIATGSATLQNAFGASALGAAAQENRRLQEAGVQEVFGQRLAGRGGLTERSFGAALGAMGVNNQAMARVAAGTTAEEEAANTRLRELGGMLGEMGDVGTQMAEMEVKSATMNVQNAEIKLQDVIDRGNAAAERADGMYRGGVVYANRGMFVPRGTDTVPAMLTPGEFVVRRQAVQRGNNLQILQAMNRGQSQSSSNGAAVGMARGGVVRYRSNGSDGPESGNIGFGISSETINRLSQSLDKFNNDLSKNIDKLNSSNFNVKLDTTNVNVNLTGGSFLSKLKEDIKIELLQELGDKIKNYKAQGGGELKESPTVLGK